MSNPYRRQSGKFVSMAFQVPVSSEICSTILTQKKKSKKMFSPLSLFFVVYYFTKVRKSNVKRKYRHKILSEWLLTEKSYLLDLTASKQLIQKPLEEMKIISNIQTEFLFPEIGLMISLSQSMIKVLEKALENSSKAQLGKEIRLFVNQYKNYSKYFSHHAKRDQILLDISQNHGQKLKQIETKMQKVLQSKQANRKLMTIKDCIDKPLYRLFKYVLLLKEYIKKLPLYHTDAEQSTKCLNQFLQINQYNNDLMKKLEQNERKNKITKMFSKLIGNHRKFVNEFDMQGLTYKLRLYIFTDVIVITKVESELGAEKLYHLGIFQLSEYFYVSEQQNLKYYKNIVIVVGKKSCFHLFFPIQQVKYEFLSCVNNLIKNIRLFEYQYRIKQRSSLSIYSINQSQLPNLKKKAIKYPSPEFLIQIQGIQYRSTGTLSSDAIFIIRFMTLQYYEDQRSFIHQNQLYQNGNQRISVASTENSDSPPFHLKNVLVPLNQRVQLQFSVIQQLYSYLQCLCSEKLPDIDPLTKDINIYSTSTRKTKSFQVRKFLLQQFLNFIFRNTPIEINPLEIKQKLKVNQHLWNYGSKRNGEIKSLQFVEYGTNHCTQCENLKISNMESYENERKKFFSIKNEKGKTAQTYCTNFYNLIRYYVVSLDKSNFNTSERRVLYNHYLQGRIDYCFLPYKSEEKWRKVIRVYLLSVEQKYIEVIISRKTTVGEVIEDIGALFELINAFDFDLVEKYGNKTRILDRDEYVSDIVNNLGIGYQQCSFSKSRIIRKAKVGFFQTLKQIISSGEDNKIYFQKTVYLSKNLQMRSYKQNPQKKQLEIEKIFWTIKRCRSRLNAEQFIQFASLYYCFKYPSLIETEKNFTFHPKIIEEIIPEQYNHFLHFDERFKRNIKLAIVKQNKILHQSKDIQSICNRIITLSYQKPHLHTYFIEAEPKQIPKKWLRGKQIHQTILIGVNYQYIIISKNQSFASIIAALPIGQVQFIVTIFSIYLYFQNDTIRFDGKMMNHFGQLIKKYKDIQKAFPNSLI